MLHKKFGAQSQIILEVTVFMPRVSVVILKTLVNPYEIPSKIIKDVTKGSIFDWDTKQKQL